MAMKWLILLPIFTLCLCGIVTGGSTTIDHFDASGSVTEKDINFLSYSATFENGILVFHIGDCGISTNYRFKGVDFTTTTKPTRTGNKLTYEAPQAKIELEFSKELIKEVVTVNNKIRLPLSHRINLSPGFAMVPNLDGSLSINNGEGVRYAIVQKPYAIDAGGKRYDLSYSWDGLILTLNGDLSKATFPVQIDPSYTIDSNNTVGQAPAICLDQNEYPHISYYDATNSSLKHAYWNGTTWITEEVDNTGTTGDSSSISIGTDNIIHIAYYEANYKVKHAYWNGTAWVTEQLPSTGNVYSSAGRKIKLLLDQNNYPQVGYFTTAATLRYMRWNGSAWGVYESINTTNQLMLDGDMGDSSLPHLSSYDNTGQRLFHHWWNGTAWNTEVVNSTLQSGRSGTSIKLDQNNYPRIAYGFKLGDSIWYSYWNGTAWTHSNTGAGNSPYGPFIDLDTSDYPHIVYYASTGSDLKCSNWNGTAWTITTLESAAGVSNYPVLTLDSQNYHHAAYYEQAFFDLNYFTDTPAPTAAFSADDTTIIEGESITFTDSSSSTTLYWRWDFDNDGNIDSLEQNPTHQYTTPGLYTVNLTVTNPSGTDSEIKVDYITVDEAPAPPLADFEANTTSGILPLYVQFTDLSTNGPTSWNWSINETYQTDQNPLYIFNVSGSYDISLTATNADGNDTETKMGYIEVLEPPTPTPTPWIPTPIPSQEMGNGTFLTTENTTYISDTGSLVPWPVWVLVVLSGIVFFCLSIVTSYRADGTSVMAFVLLLAGAYASNMIGFVSVQASALNTSELVIEPTVTAQHPPWLVWVMVMFALVSLLNVIYQIYNIYLKKGGERDYDRY